MPEAQLTLFGPPTFKRDSVRVDFGLRKAFSLVAYLAVEKKPHSREALAALFWPDLDHSQALGSLRKALYRVNHSAGIELLSAGRSLVEFNQDVALYIDVDVFQKCIEGCLCTDNSDFVLTPSCLENLRQAAGLYTADFMAGFSLPDCPVFDEWQFFQTDSLRKSFNHVLKCLVDEYQKQGSWEAAIHYARRRLALDALEESAHRDLMELYALNNQFGAALRQYHECRRFLEAELGILPDGETTALYRMIKQRRIPVDNKQPVFQRVEQLHNNFPAGISTVKNGGLTLLNWQESTVLENRPVRKTNRMLKVPPFSIKAISRPGPPSNIPLQPFPFIGRRGELEEIQQLLTGSADLRLVTITGPGGIGKTRLAIEAALEVIRLFPDGVFLVSLSRVHSAQDIPEVVAREVGLGLQGDISADHVITHLSNKQMLLVLDSYEHLVYDVNFINQLLQRAPAVKILVTSRERLYISRETVYSLAGMDYPCQDCQQDILEFSSVQLFLQIARTVKPQLSFDEQDFAAIGRICRIVQGMPLAILLSASWLLTLPLEQIAEEINQNLEFLHGKMRDLPERQQSVLAAFEYSWKRLQEEEQKTFMQLSVFSCGFSHSAAQQVAAATLPTLRSLIDKSFIYMGQDGRYQIHELLRQYGEEHLRESGETSIIHSRHSQFFMSWLSGQEQNLKGVNQVKALREIEAELPNIYTAWVTALMERNTRSIQIVLNSLILFCGLRGQHHAGVELLEMARDQLKPGDGMEADLVYGSILTRLSYLISRSKRYDPDLDGMIQDGLEIARRFGDKHEIAFGLFSYGHYLANVVHDFELAELTYRESLELFEEMGADYFVGRAYHMIGFCCAFLKGIGIMSRYLKISLQVARRIVDRHSETMLLTSLSMASFYLGDFEAANYYAGEAADTAKVIDKGTALAQTDIFLGIVYLLQGQLEKAKEFAESGRKRANTVEFPVPLAFYKAVAGVLACFDGNTAEGVCLIQECKEIPIDPLNKIFTHWAAALVYCQAGELGLARAEIEAIAASDQKYGTPILSRMALPIAASILTMQGQLGEAVEILGVTSLQHRGYRGWTEHWPLFKEKTMELAARLQEDEYRIAWKRGREKTVENTLEEMLEKSHRPKATVV
jgi:predicted ATPase/DNA-binding SARP family transcriptional activator